MKTFCFLILSVICLLFSACTAQPASTATSTATPASTSQAAATATTAALGEPEPRPTPTPRAGPVPATDTGDFTFNGNFALTNTSVSGMQAGIEAMQFVLESRLSTAAQWEEIEVECSFDPPAPFVLKREQAVHYECLSLRRPPAGVELRAAVEVQVFGAQEIFRQEIALP